MAGIKAANPDDILQAIEDKLVSAAVVDSADAVYWVIDGDDSEVKPTGIRRILLYWTDEVARTAWQIGGGRLTTLMDFECEIRLDSFQAQDPATRRKDWMKDNWAKRALVIDTVLGLFPTDGALNAMTIYGLRMVRNSPQQANQQARWGKSICTLSGSFMPKINYALRSQI